MLKKAAIVNVAEVAVDAVGFVVETAWPRQVLLSPPCSLSSAACSRWFTLVGSTAAFRSSGSPPVVQVDVLFLGSTRSGARRADSHGTL